MKKHAQSKIVKQVMRTSALSRGVQAALVSFAGAYVLANPALVQAQVAGNAVTTDNGAASAVSHSAPYQANVQVGQVLLSTSALTLQADGQSAADVTVSVLDMQGNPVRGDVVLTIETNAGRILLPTARTDELGPGRLDADRTTPGTQLRVGSGGKASFKVVAPSVPQDGLLRVTAGRAHGQAQLSFVPHVRELMAVGLVEGIVTLRKLKNGSTLTPVRTEDGFDLALRGFEKEFNQGTNKAGTVAARAAFYVKGAISGQTLLTAAYDSDKETRTRLLRDIRADELYPVFGDASLKTFDAQSTQKFYVRLDNGKNYVLYGDFNTGAGFGQSAGSGSGVGSIASVRQRDLGNYNRTMTGVRGHVEGDYGHVNLYGAHDTLKQQVEEVRGNGGSFYNLSRSDSLENSEKIELIVRDRANPGRILSVQTLQRFADYTFEPFNGRIITKGPVQSTDAQGNPQTLRMSYEVDQGGSKYLVAGVDGQLKVGSAFEIGGSYVKDKNPTLPQAGIDQLKELASVNVGVKLGEQARLVVEAAQTTNSRTASVGGVTTTQDVDGKAVRAELAFAVGGAGAVGVQTVTMPGSVSEPLRTSAQGAASNFSGSVFYAKADKDFNNPGASVVLGRSEAGVKLQGRLTQSLTLKGEILKTEDSASSAERQSAYIGADYQFNDKLSAQIGVRRSEDNGQGLLNPTFANSSTSLYGTGGIFNPGGAGVTNSTVFATGSGTALDTTTVHLGLRARVSDSVTLGLEGEGSVTGTKASRAAASAEWQVAERTKLQARYETQTGLGSYADRERKADTFVLGVSNTYLNQGLGTGSGGVQGELFSEYRLRDALGGRESQIANGLRNTFSINENWRAVAGAEYIKVLAGASNPSLAISTGLDYIGSGLWKGSGRLEWRKTQGGTGSTGIMSTLSAARKLDRDWTLLARNYYATTDAAATPGAQMQDRVQVGFAYRPVDAQRFDMLGKLEYKIEKNTETATVAANESRNVLIGSLHGNWHPGRDLWMSGRIAAKVANETFPSAATGGGLTAAKDKYSATLIGGRVIYDITKSFDLGLAASVMQGNGSRQYAYGIEAGYLLRRNLWLSAGYNFAGFTDRDLTGNDYTAKGPYLRLRAKFDETLFGGANDTDTKDQNLKNVPVTMGGGNR